MITAMTNLITLLLLAIVAFALVRYTRHDGFAAPRPRSELRDERDHIRPTHVFG